MTWDPFQYLDLTGCSDEQYVQPKGYATEPTKPMVRFESSFQESRASEPTVSPRELMINGDPLLLINEPIGIPGGIVPMYYPGGKIVEKPNKQTLSGLESPLKCSKGPKKVSSQTCPPIKGITSTLPKSLVTPLKQLQLGQNARFIMEAVRMFQNLESFSSLKSHAQILMERTGRNPTDLDTALRILALEQPDTFSQHAFNCLSSKMMGILAEKRLPQDLFGFYKARYQITVRKIANQMALRDDGKAI